ncbi:unnamed protein product, partial [Symbiodinium pilosum]
MSSPTNTPAMPSVPDWAHPTPSPSLMVRMPDPKAWQAPHFGSMLNGKALPGMDMQSSSESSLRTLLSQVCAPFVQGMVTAVEQLVQQEVERQVKLLRQQDCHASMNWPRRMSREQPQQHAYGNPSEGIPFGHVFAPQQADPQNQNTGEPDTMKLANVASLPLREESSEDECEADGDHRGHFQALFGGKAPTSHSRSSSFSERSNATPSEADDAKPPGFSGQRQGLASAPSTDGPGDPLYLQWSRGQSHGERPSLTPTVSPVTPQVSPSVAGNQRQGTKQSVDSSHPADAGAAQAKSAVVCRHWKSKGWCRLGDECKFAHPEHKCGAGAQIKKEKDRAITPSVG